MKQSLWTMMRISVFFWVFFLSALSKARSGCSLESGLGESKNGNIPAGRWME